LDDGKDTPILKEIGLKLQNFRKKLALAVGLKRITQPEFGQMFGGYSERQITSYETGSVEIPARLLYLIWRSGNSIDAVFAEQPISEEGGKSARDLYDGAKVTATELINAADDTRRKKTTRKATAVHVAERTARSEKGNPGAFKPRPDKKRHRKK
jgi:cation transport regulator ChaB